jgi:Fur family peroxide stress response transcriptional regulator
MSRNYSTKRQAIYDMLKSRTDHPSAKQIYNALKNDYPDLSLGTVYRNIALFKEDGLAETVCTIQGEERLDGNTSPHAHLICTCCGSITDVYISELDALEQEIYKEDFLPEKKVISYYGKCHKCR